MASPIAPDVVLDKKMSNVKYEPEKFDVRIFDQKGDGYFVDLETLTHILQGVQKAILVLAKDALRLPSTKAIPAKIKKTFSIRCSVPKPGSYVMPLEFGESNELFFEDSQLETPRFVADRFFDYLKALVSGDISEFNKITDVAIRRQLLVACRPMLPKLGAKWRVGISRPTSQHEVQFTPKTIHNLKRIQEQVLIPEEASLQTVTGYLVKMDFESRCITLKYPLTKTELECYYTDELEVELFENRRELLQVTGNVTYERDRETPKKIVDVEDIQFLDLSEFVLESFSLDDAEIDFIEPLVLAPSLTESSQFITLQNELLGIDVIAQTREELEEALLDDLKILWEQSQMPDSKLGKVFQEQKKNLLAATKEA